MEPITRWFYGLTEPWEEKGGKVLTHVILHSTRAFGLLMLLKQAVVVDNRNSMLHFRQGRGGEIVYCWREEETGETVSVRVQKHGVNRNNNNNTYRISKGKEDQREPYNSYDKGEYSPAQCIFRSAGFLYAPWLREFVFHVTGTLRITIKYTALGYIW